MSRTGAAPDIAQVCADVSELLAGRDLYLSEVGQVLERLVADLCMKHELPRVAAEAITYNIRIFVEVGLGKSAAGE